MPGGTKGILLKSWIPNKYTQDDNEGFTRKFLNKLNVSSPCSINLSHFRRGKPGLHVASSVRRWFFKVHMVLSADFWRCLLGGTSSKLISYHAHLLGSELSINYLVCTLL